MKFITLCMKRRISFIMNTIDGVFGFALVVCFVVNVVSGSPEEDRLLTKLFENDAAKYNKIVRPAPSVRDNVDVTIDLIIASIVDLNEQQEQLTLLLWYELEWTDYRLTWNASDYGNVDHLSVPTEKMWIPDISLMNNVKDDSGRVGIADDTASKIILVRANGTCLWKTSSLSVSHCSVDVQWFPFDEQVCKLQYELWGQESSDVNLTYAFDEAFTGFSEKNSDGEWTLVSSPMSMEEFRLSDSEAEKPIRTITCTLNLKRKPLHYVMNFVVPSFAFSVISLLTFLLDPASGERIGLSLTLLLSIAVYQMIISDKLPVSDSLPLLGVYFLFVMLMCAASILMFIVVIYLQTVKSPMPRPLRRAVRSGLCNAFRLNRLRSSPDESATDNNDVVEPLLNDVTALEMSPALSDVVTVSITDSLLLNILRLIQVRMRFETQQISEQYAMEDRAQDWTDLARIIDRLFFVLFTSLFVAGTVAFFINIRL